MRFSYKPKGVCSMQINIDLDGDIVREVEFVGGCEGNLSGISRLVAGLTTDELIGKLAGIRCGRKKTSCPDQLVLALQAALAQSRAAVSQSTAL